MKKRILLTILLLLSITIIVSCDTAKEEILKGEISLNSMNQHMGFNPAKIKINELSENHKINYTITNYNKEKVTIELSETQPANIDEGYNYRKETEEIWLIIPEKTIEIEGGQSYETQILLGCPYPKTFTTPIEIWISCKMIDTNYSLNLISKILINEVTIDEKETY